MSVGVTSLVPGVYALVTTPVTSAPGTNSSVAASTDPQVSSGSESKGEWSASCHMPPLPRRQVAAARVPTRLVEGQSSLAAVAAGGWQYFDIPLRSVPVGATYWASVVELTGSTRVWSISNGSFPTAALWAQAPPAVVGVQLVTYAPGSAGYNPGPTGTLIVGVYGATGAAFTITFGSAATVVELLVRVAIPLPSPPIVESNPPAPPLCSPACPSPRPSRRGSTPTTRCASAALPRAT